MAQRCGRGAGTFHTHGSQNSHFPVLGWQASEETRWSWARPKARGWCLWTPRDSKGLGSMDPSFCDSEELASMDHHDSEGQASMDPP